MLKSLLNETAIKQNIEMSSDQMNALETFTVELKKWNSRINLTAINSDEDIAIKHLADVMILVKHVHTDDTVLEIGSGAGIPSIPLKIMLPDIKITSVDTVGKKITFQRHIARLLRLSEFEAIKLRIDSNNKINTHKYDVILSRAFARLDIFARIAAPMLSMDGRMIAMKGPSIETEICSVEETLLREGFFISEIETYDLPQNKGKRYLVTIKVKNNSKTVS